AASSVCPAVPSAATSTASVATRPLSAHSASAAASSLRALRPMISTEAPARESAVVTPCPTPCPAPVITVTLPSRDLLLSTGCLTICALSSGILEHVLISYATGGH